MRDETLIEPEGEDYYYTDAVSDEAVMDAHRLHPRPLLHDRLDAFEPGGGVAVTGVELEAFLECCSSFEVAPRLPIGFAEAVVDIG